VLARTPTAFDTAAALLEDGALASVAVGTLATPEDIDRAVEIGADAGISAWFDPVLVARAGERGLAYCPTVETSSEAARAVAAGCTHLKLFPAEVSGGAERLRLFAGVFPEVRFMATGGVGQDNLAAYLALPSVLAVGGAWFMPPERRKAGDWDGIASAARTVRRAARAARGSDA